MVVDRAPLDLATEADLGVRRSTTRPVLQRSRRCDSIARRRWPRRGRDGAFDRQRSLGTTWRTREGSTCSISRPRGSAGGGGGRAQRPDVVLMDLSMPGVDGVEATRRILADQPDVKVVVLTSFSDRGRVSDALAAGAVGYLLKDCEPADLLAAVRAAARATCPSTRGWPGCSSRTRRDPSRGRDEPARARGAAARGPRPGQQADRSPSRHQRAHGQGPPGPGVPAARRGSIAPVPRSGRTTTCPTGSARRVRSRRSSVAPRRSPSPGVSTPRMRLQPPQVRSWSAGHSGSCRSVSTKPLRGQRRRPSHRGCGGARRTSSAPVTSSTSTYGVRSQ